MFWITFLQKKSYLSRTFIKNEKCSDSVQLLRFEGAGVVQRLLWRFAKKDPDVMIWHLSSDPSLILIHVVILNFVDVEMLVIATLKRGNGLGVPCVPRVPRLPRVSAAPPTAQRSIRRLSWHCGFITSWQRCRSLLNYEIHRISVLVASCLWDGRDFYVHLAFGFIQTWLDVSRKICVLIHPSKILHNSPRLLIALNSWTLYKIAHVLC